MPSPPCQCSYFVCPTLYLSRLLCFCFSRSSHSPPPAWRWRLPCRVILAGTASPLWSGSWYATPNASSMHRRSSSANVLLPRRIGLLASTITVSVGRFYAELQGLIFLGLSLLLTAVLTLPLSIVTALLILVAIWLIVASLNSDTSQAEAGEWFLIIGLLLGALWMGLSCHKPRQRTKAPYSVDRFQVCISIHRWRAHCTSCNHSPDQTSSIL